MSSCERELCGKEFKFPYLLIRHLNRVTSCAPNKLCIESGKAVEKTIGNQEKVVSTQEKVVSVQEKVVPDEEKVVPDSQNVINKSKKVPM